MLDRKVRYALIASFLLISSHSFARDEAAAITPQSPETNQSDAVSGLIDQLGAEEWTARETATNALVELGTQVVEQLQTALASANDPEVRSRLETAIAQINENELIGASIISMNFVDASIAEVIQSLNQQAKCNIVVNVPEPASSRKITLRLDRASFWNAIDEIERATGLNFAVQQQVWMLGRQGRGFQPQYTCESGPLQFTAMKCDVSVSYTDGDLGVGKSSLLLAVRGEPKVRLAPGKTRIMIDKAIDDLGNDLTSTREVSGIWLDERAVGNATIPLARPRDIGTKITELSGYVELSLATRVETIRIENLADFEPFERSSGTMKIRFEPPNEGERAQLQPGWQAVKISATDNVNRDLLQQRLGSAVNMARVVDARGRPASRPSVNFSTGDVPNEFRYYIVFQPGAADPNSALSLRLDIPIEYRQITTRFNFKDLPLP